MPPVVLAVVAKLDGLNVLLFHVEQWDNQTKWFFRVWGEDDWMPEVALTGRSVTIPVPHATDPLKVEWREADGDWQSAVPHEFGEARAEFVVRVDLPFDAAAADDGVHVCGVVGGAPSVWRLDLPRRVLAQDGPETLRVSGVSLCPGMGQILDCPGDFRVQGGFWKVVNVGPSQAALLRVDDAVPGMLPFRGVYMVRSGGRLTDEEMDLLLEEEAEWRRS